MTETPDFASMLIEALDEQIESQTRLAALCDAQTGALMGRDVARLEGLTCAIENAILDQRATEERRAFAAEGLARELGLDDDSVTLTLGNSKSGKPLQVMVSGLLDAHGKPVGTIVTSL